MLGSTGIRWQIIFVLVCIHWSTQNTFTHSFLLVGATSESSAQSGASHLAMMKTPKDQSSSPKKTMSTLISNCACGKVTVRVQIPSSPGSDQESIAVDCHCPACRKYHVAAFASYLQVPAEHVDLDENNQDLQVFRESCQQLGPVQRFFCRHCYTKVATKPIRAMLEPTTDGSTESDGDQQATTADTPTTTSVPMVLINMGGLVDKSIPQAYQKAWSKGRTRWQESSQAAWTTALPLRPRTMPPLVTTTTTGSCACGKCQYQIRHVPYEMQHCYCRLCRQLCGSAYQSWIPVMNEDIVWQEPVPALKRTTEHGKRHICTTCGSCLTIVYDDQPDMTWPAAGGLDDVSLPSPLDPHLDRVCHICCTWKQSWYAIPKDGMDRIKYAC